MRAVTYDRFGPASEVLSLLDMPVPEPGAGEVLVRLHASGVNPSDVRVRAGGRPGVTAPPFPVIVPHSDGAGVIEAVGPGVPSDRIGQRVWIWNGQWRRPFGTAADYIALPSDQAVVLADHLSFEEGAVLGIPGLTAVHSVLGGGPVAGRRVLVSGGAGTVGRIAVQVAHAAGAEVIATAHGAEGIEAARTAGADHVLDYSAPDLAEQILAATGGAAIDRIVEVEFGKNAETNARVIAEGGIIASYGSAKDMTPELPFYPLMFKAVTIDLVLVYLLTPDQRRKAVDELATLIDRKALDLRLSAILPLAECARAHEIVEAGNRAGSVILTL